MTRLILACLVTFGLHFHFIAPLTGLMASGILGQHEIEKNCSIRESCSHQHLVGNEKLYLCRCDENCSLYNDCCYDSNDSSSQNGVLKAADSLQCVKESRIIMSQPIYMIRSCPKWFDNEYIRSKCEDLPTECDSEIIHQSIENVIVDQMNSEDGPGISSVLPVTASKTGLLYKNLYCALCHEEKHVQFWNVKFLSRRPFDIDILNDTNNLRLLLEKSLKGGHRAMGFSAPQGIDPYRTCTMNINKCQTNKTQASIVTQASITQVSNDRSCSEPTSYAFSGGKTFRNKECALCNGVAQEDIGCIDPNLYLTSGGGRRPPPSFALLLDFNFGMGQFIQQGRSRVGFQQVQQEVALPLPAECDHNGDEMPTLYDPFTERCVRLSCPSGYQLGCGEMCQASSQLAAASEEIIMLKFGHVLGYLTLVGNIISIIGLIIQLMVYIHLPSLRNTPGKCLMCLSSWLLVSQAIFTFGVNRTEIYGLCYTMSVVLHFGFLSYFFWMNVMAYDVWHAFGNASRNMNAKNKQKNRSFISYCLYASIVPSVITLVSVILDQTEASVRPLYAGHFCWIGDKKGGLLLFALPLIIVMTMNIIFFVLTARNICIAAEGTSLVRKEKTRAGLYAKLALIMGLTWTTGLAVMALDRVELWYVYTVLNSFQGIFICFSFVCTRKVYRAFSDKLLVYKQSRSVTSSTKQTYILNGSDAKATEFDYKQPLREAHTGT